MYTLTDAIKRQFVETKKHGKRNMDDHLKNGICIQTINMDKQSITWGTSGGIREPWSVL